MRAAVRTRYGAPDVDHLAHVPEPLPGEREILVAVCRAQVIWQG